MGTGDHGLELTAAVETADRADPTRTPLTAVLGTSRPLGEKSSLPREFVLRDPDWGSNDLDPWETDSAVTRVMRSLNTEAAERAGVPLDDVVNFERTRVFALPTLRLDHGE